MVSGINFSKYSVDQLKELKANGIDVPKQAIADAEAKEAANATSTDEQNVKYEIADDASKTNEAEDEVKAAEESGANLKTILQTLIPKCETKNSEMEELQKEIDKFQTISSSTQTELNAVSTDATKTTDNVKNDIKSMMTKAESKQKEIETKQAELKTLTSKQEYGIKLTDDEQSKVNNLKSTIQTLNGELTDITDSITTIENNAKTKIAVAQEKAASLGRTMEGVKMEAEAAANKATDANEYADVTIEKGTQASNISSKKDAKTAGFKKSGFLGFGKKGNVKAANNMGNEAIAKGEKLGGATVNIAKNVETIADQYNFAFSKTSDVKNLSAKEYVDTSKMKDLQSTTEDNFSQRIKNIKVNQNIYNEIADASKKKGTKEAETKAE